MVLLEQLVALLDYLEGNLELARGNCVKTKAGREFSLKCWTECAKILNSISPNCPKKSAGHWRLYYNEVKYKTLKKVRDLKKKRAAGGKIHPLSPTQKRLYNILKECGDISHLLRGGQKRKVSKEELPYEQSINVMTELEHPSSPAPSPTPVYMNNASSPESDRYPKRAKFIKIEKGHGSRRKLEHDEEMAQLLDAQKRLEGIERLYAEAIMAQARATDRLAASIERAVERLNEPLVLVVERPASQGNEGG